MNEEPRPDLAPAADGEPWCSTLDGRYGLWCTRPAGHDGDHAAHGLSGLVPLLAWTQSEATE